MGDLIKISHIIRKTCLYNFDPFKPHFYVVKLGFTGVYIIFLISAQKAVLMSTHNLCFEQKYEEYQNFLSDLFHFLVVKFSVYLNRRVFVMCKRVSTRCRKESNPNCNHSAYSILNNIY